MRNKINTELSSEEEEAEEEEEKAKVELYQTYNSAAEIDYQLDEAVKQGNLVTTGLDTLINTLTLSAQRKEVWSTEIERRVKFPPSETHSIAS